MSKNYYLVTDSQEYKLEIDEKTGIYKELLSHVPIIGEGKNIGGEIFYIIDVDIPFNGNEKEVFNVGDIIYWRSQKQARFAIALFYGNTKFGDGNAPTAASPGIKFASIVGDCKNLELVESGSRVRIIEK